MGNSIEIAPSDSDEGLGMYSDDSAEDEIEEESTLASSNYNHNHNLDEGAVDEDDLASERERRHCDSEQEASLSVSGSASHGRRHQRERVSVYVAPMEAAEQCAEKRRQEAARAQAAKERELPMPGVTDYAVPALNALIRFDLFKVDATEAADWHCERFLS